MLETDALECVVQFDVDTEVVGIEFQLVAGLDAGILVDGEVQRGDRAVEAQPPVLVAIRVGVIGDGLRGGFWISPSLLRVVMSVFRWSQPGATA